MTTEAAYLEEQRNIRLGIAESNLLIYDEMTQAALDVLNTESLSLSDRLLNVKLLIERARQRQEAPPG